MVFSSGGVCPPSPVQPLFSFVYVLVLLEFVFFCLFFIRFAGKMLLPQCSVDDDDDNEDDVLFLLFLCKIVFISDDRI